MSKYNFKTERELLGYLFNIINQKEELTVHDQLELIGYYIENFEKKNYNLQVAIKEIYKNYVEGEI